MSLGADPWYLSVSLPEAKPESAKQGKQGKGRWVEKPSSDSNSKMLHKLREQLLALKKERKEKKKKKKHKEKKEKKHKR